MNSAKNYFQNDVGIGTQNPAAMLHLNSNNYATLQMGNNAAGQGMHLTKESGDNSFNIWSGAIGSGVNRLKITQAGNVGIGTQGPTERLDLGGGNIKMGYSTREATVSDPNVAGTGVLCPSGIPVGGRLPCQIW